MQKLILHIVLITCLAGSIPGLRNELEPMVIKILNDLDRYVEEVINNDDQFISLTGLNSESENDLSIGARINYKVPSNLSSLASCALLTTVESNNWIHNSSAKSNHLFQGRFDGPFSFLKFEDKKKDHYRLKDKFSQGDLSHFTDPTNVAFLRLTTLDESYFCSQQLGAANFGRGVCSEEYWVGNRNADTCS